MRIWLFGIGLVLSNVICAQSLFNVSEDRFSTFIPDSLIEMKFLKNWKLNGPVKLVVLETYEGSSFGGYSKIDWNTQTKKDIKNVANSSFDDNRPYYISISRTDSFLFSSNSLLQKVATDGFDWDLYSGRYKMLSDDKGFPVMFIGDYNDTIVYEYDQLGRLIRKEMFNGNEYGDKIIWEYRDSTLATLFVKGACERYAFKLKEWEYNAKGQLIKRRSYYAFYYDYFKLDTPSEISYYYDDAGNVISIKQYLVFDNSEILYEYPLLTELLSMIAGDTSVIDIKYNSNNQVVEAKAIVQFNEGDKNYGIIQFEYDNKGQLISSSVLRTTKDSNDLVLLSTKNYIYEYDNYNNPIKIVYTTTFRNGYQEWSTMLMQIQLIEYEYYK